MMLRSLLLWFTSGVILSTISASQPDADLLETYYGFSDLTLSSFDYVQFESRAVIRIQEDKYQPGSYFLMYLGFILKHKPGEPMELFLGHPDQQQIYRYQTGNSSVAEFSVITDMVQYNRTKYALSDYLNNCVREYDSETDMFTPLIGACAEHYSTSVGSLQPGVAIAGDSNFISGALDIELVESANYFILCDHGYGQVTTYDLNTGLVQLLLDSNDKSLPSPTSLLLSSDEMSLYVSHTNGLSRVDLETKAVQLLVGEAKVSLSTDPPVVLATGPFRSTTLGSLSSLTWLKDNEILFGVSDTLNTLIVLDLILNQAMGSCTGDDRFNSSLTGPQTSCRFHKPTAATFSNGSVYVAAVTEGEYNFFSPSSLYEIQVNLSQVNSRQIIASTTIKAEEMLTTTSKPNSNVLCPHCSIQVSVDSLEKVEYNLNGLPRRPIDFMIEDEYNDGEFFFNSGHLLLKYVPGEPVQHVLGKDYEGMRPEDIRYKAGNSSTAEFALLGGVAQVNETIMLVADYLNNCIRQYDMVTDNITEFIGSCEGTLFQSREILPGQEVPANTHFLSGPLKIVMIKSQNYLIVMDHGYQLITRYSFEKKTIRLLGDQLSDSLPNPRDILPTSDESAIYVVHSYGLSRVDLSTLEVTLVTGEVSSSANNVRNVAFSPGSFDTAVIGYIETIRWLVPDRLMVTIGTRLNEELIFIDLDEKEIYSTCIGSEDNNQTVTGPPGTCKLNAPTSLLVTRDRQIYIAGLTDVKYSSYRFNTSSSIFHMNAYVSQCEFKAPTGYEIADKPNIYYYQFDTIVLSCPPGMALNSSTDTLQCLENSTWSQSSPHCVKVTSQSDIHSLSPTFGQLSGGTLVTAVGLIPSTGVVVYVNSSDGVMSPVEHNIKPQKLSFKMPNHTEEGEVQLIIKLSENVTAKYDFVYGKDPVLNHTIRSATLASGGFDVEFGIVNAESSNNYTLFAPTLGETFACSYDGRTLRCAITQITAKQENLTNPWYLPVHLLSDGIPVENSENLNLTIYSDPEIETETISLTVGKPLILRGKNLDVGILNEYYVIMIDLAADVSVVCEIEKVSDSSIQCQPQLGDHKPNSSPKAVSVYIAHLKLNPTSAVFLLAVSSTPVAPRLAGGSIAAIVVVTLVSIIIVIAVILWYRNRHASRVAANLRINSLRFTKEDNQWFVSINIDLKAKLDSLLIESDALKIKEGAPIGQGNFGTIYLGQMCSGESVKTVAVKTLKDMETTIPIIEKFLEEAVILQDFKHANVLETLGVSIPDTDTPQVVLPYMANGDLKSLIQMEHMQFSIGDLMHFAKQIACGMEYLSNNKFIHRDLAARNCLVSDKYIVKIADFGLSKDIYSNDYYRRDEQSNTALPVKWLAIESLREGKFSTESDVWSYGVLMWELCTRGSQPYPDVDAWDIRRYLEEGRRLHQPNFCPPVIFGIMSQCWLENPEERPSFTVILEFLNKLLENTECSPQSPYSYIREYTKDIPVDYVEDAMEVEMEDYLVPKSAQDRKMNDYLAAV